VMVVQSNVVLGPLVNKNLPFDIERDLTPVAILSEAPTLYATGMSTPVTDMRGLIALAKGKPDQLFYATNGNGSSQHINVARLQKQAGVRMADIAYKGDGAALLALAAGDIQLHAGTANSYIALAKAGKIRVLGVASDKRSKVFPDVPTMAEQGIPFRHGSWFGYMTRKGVPADITARLNREFNRITRMQDVQAQIIALGMEPVQVTPKEMGDFIASELTTWTPVVRELGLTN
jgi:tripartite-type tricarboxylate transporter receptor subunit TctC